MDPVQKMWMFYNWFGDQKDTSEVAKNHAYLVGSFYNPESVKKLLDQENGSFVSTEEEFEESSRMVLEGAVEIPGLLKPVEPISTTNNEKKNVRKRRFVKG